MDAKAPWGVSAECRASMVRWLRHRPGADGRGRARDCVRAARCLTKRKRGASATGEDKLGAGHSHQDAFCKRSLLSNRRRGTTELHSLWRLGGIPNQGFHGSDSRTFPFTVKTSACLPSLGGTASIPVPLLCFFVVKLTFLCRRPEFLLAERWGRRTL